LVAAVVPVAPLAGVPVVWVGLVVSVVPVVLSVAPVVLVVVWVVPVEPVVLVVVWVVPVVVVWVVLPMVGTGRSVVGEPREVVVPMGDGVVGAPGAPVERRVLLSPYPAVPTGRRMPAPVRGSTSTTARIGGPGATAATALGTNPAQRLPV
jgi:hypothetical protein